MPKEKIKAGNWYLRYQDKIEGIVPSSHLLEPIRIAELKGYELHLENDGEHLWIGTLCADFLGYAIN